MLFVQCESVSAAVRAPPRLPRHANLWQWILAGTPAAGIVGYAISALRISIIIVMNLRIENCPRNPDGVLSYLQASG